MSDDDNPLRLRLRRPAAASSRAPSTTAPVGGPTRESADATGGSNTRRTVGDGDGAGFNLGLILLSAIVAVCAIAMPLVLSYGIEVIAEGSVGVVRFGGKILDETKAPGFHLLIPFLYEVEEVPVNVRTTEIRHVECGTSGGVLIHLPSVEIVHRLHPRNVVSTLRTCDDYVKTWIIERVRHDVNQMCARHTLHEIYIDKFDQLDDMIVSAVKETVSEWVPGLQIIAARVAKPDIPKQLRGDFVRVEEEVSKLKVRVDAVDMIAHQHEHLVIRNAEAERSKQVMAAEKNRDIATLTMARELEEKQADLHIQRIEDEMYVARSKDHADATGYSQMREADGNERRLSPAFLELERRKALYQNLEAHYGDRMPEYIQDRPKQRSLTTDDESGVNAARGAAAFWRK